MAGVEQDDRGVGDVGAERLGARGGEGIVARLRVAGRGEKLRADTRWHTELGGNAALAALATEAITLIGQPGRRNMLRRSANPNWSMLFLAQTTRRQWCTPNICGNRARVARHYQRTHTNPRSDPQ